MSQPNGLAHPPGANFLTHATTGTSTVILMHHQLQEAQQAANEEGHLQYKAWLQQGQAKGLKGLFRSFKSSEIPWQRPYRQLPPDQRMTQRLHDWGTLWQIRQDNQPTERPSLKAQAQQQAQQLKPSKAYQTKPAALMQSLHSSSELHPRFPLDRY